MRRSRFLSGGDTTMTRKLWLALLLTALPLILLAACSAGTSEPDAELTDLDIRVMEASEPEELDPGDLLVAHFIDVGEGDALLRCYRSL